MIRTMFSVKLLKTIQNKNKSKERTDRSGKPNNWSYLQGGD